MSSITIHFTNKEQESAITKLLKAFEISFEKTKEKSPYDPVFVQKILEAQQEVKEGKATRVTKENQKAFLGL